MTTAPGARTRLPENNLDILRAIAVLLVLVDHTMESLGSTAPFVRWLGQAGVQAFFVHTSLVLMASLERDGAPHRPHWIRRFYVRRAMRIYPLAWAVIAAVLLLRIPGGLIPAEFRPPTLLKVVTNLALVQDLAGQSSIMFVLWTLPFEMQMYVALPFCYLLARKRGWLGMFALLLAGLAVASFYTYSVQPSHRLPGVQRLHVLEFVPCFLMGLFAYWALRRQTAAIAPLPPWVWPLIILVDVPLSFSLWGKLWPSWIVRGLFAAVLGLAIPVVRDAAPSMVTRIAHIVATYSYGVYLIHPLAIRSGFWLLRNTPLGVQFAVTGAVLVLSCYASYHLIEKPGIALGQRMVGARRGRALSSEGQPHHGQ